MNGYFSIGNIIKVNSSSVTILVKDFTHLERIHYNGTIYKGISVGTFVGVIRGSDKIVVQIIKESINNIEESFDGSTLLKNKVQRKLVAKIIGVIGSKGYETGIKSFPLMFDDVVLLSKEELKKIYYLSQEKKQNVLNIGKMSLYDELRVKIPINGFLDTHIGVFGNTGSGKSNTVAKLYTTLFDKINKESKLKNIKSTFVFVDFHNEYENYFSNYEKIKVKTISPSDEDFKISASPFWNYEALIGSFWDFSQEEKKFIKKIIDLKKEKFDFNTFYNIMKYAPKDSLKLEDLKKILGNKEIYLKTLLNTDLSAKRKEFKHLLDTHSEGGKINYSTLKTNEKYQQMINEFSKSRKEELTYKEYGMKLDICYEREWLLFQTNLLVKKIRKLFEIREDYAKSYLLKKIYYIWKKFYKIDFYIFKDQYSYVNCLLTRNSKEIMINWENPFSGFYIEDDEISQLEQIKVCLAITELSISKWEVINENIFDKIQNKLLDLIPKNMSYIPQQIIKINSAQIIILSLKDEDVELQKTWPIVVANELFNSQKTLYSRGVDSSVHFIIDEAHNLISSKLSEETKDENINRLSLFEKFIREGRKFNFFLTISTQEPWGLDSGINSQLGNFFIHRFVNGNDLEIINKYIANSNDILYNKIPILNPGQCILWGSKFKTPLMIQVDEMKEEQVGKLKKETKNKSLEDIWGLE